MTNITENNILKSPNFISGYYGQVTSTGTTTLTVGSEHTQRFIGTLNNDVVLPDVATLVLGLDFEIINDSLGIITVKSNGLNTVSVVYPATRVLFKCVALTGTGVSSWSIVKFRDRHYGEMYMYNNAVVCVIDTANIYHAVYNTFGNNDGVLAPNTDSSFVYFGGLGRTITAFADYSGTVAGTTKVTTSAIHDLSTGQPITITATTNYNGKYLVKVIDATNFYITKAYVTNDATGSVRRPATLRSIYSGIFQASFNITAICATNNENFRFELNKDVTELDNIGIRNIFTTSPTYRNVGAGGLVSLNAGQYLWLSVKNFDGAHNITIESANVYIHRI